MRAVVPKLWRGDRAGLARLWASAVLVALLVACGGGGGEEESRTSETVSGSQVLSIGPVYQQTEVWCWAAVAEMVFRYYSMPSLNASSYQCGIVGAYYGPQSVCWGNCNLCRSGIGPVSQMQVLITGYGQFANNFAPSRILSSRLLLRPLSYSETAKQINAGQPVVAGISPSGVAYPNISEHAVLIVGFDNSANDNRLIVNDPFPYEAFAGSMINPYIASGGRLVRLGQYSIPYAAFVGPMLWANTVDMIR